MTNQENQQQESSQNNQFENYTENIENYSPLDSPVKQRDYTNHKIDSHEPLAELEEPQFDAPSFDAHEEVQETETSSSSKKEKEPVRQFNESYSELDGKEKAMGAEMMAEMALDLYAKGCGLLGKLPEISETKLDRLIAEGEINPKITLQTEEGALPIKQFAVGYNESLRGAFGVSEEFKENIKPPLIRIFKKRGVGMTDEQLVAYYLATDLGTKGVQAVMLRKTTNSILDQLKQNTIALNEQNAVKTPPAPQVPPVVHQEPIKAKIVDNNKESEYTDDISEAVVISKPKARKNRKLQTNLDKQIANFTEPEENDTFANLGEVNGFAHDYVQPDGMPEFGNKDILNQMEQIAKNPTRPVRTTKNTGNKGK